MATLDDKLLGEKLHNYCSSSSEDEDEPARPKFIPESELKEQEKFASKAGQSVNTGPKGVIQDWQRFKQLQHEKGQESKMEREKIIKRLAMTCKSDEIDKEIQKEKINTKKEDDMDELDDGFFEEYLKKKFEEMQSKLLSLPKFGKVIELDEEKFISEIDNEQKNVTIIIHIYDTKINECNIMNECLETIAKDYTIVKICKVRSSAINLSEKFRKYGCPALLIYKNKEMIGNFVKMNDEFGDEFCTSDVENFLIEQGFLPSQEMPVIIRNSSSTNTKESDDEN
ncbi:phosducin [Brachionus plicatilis]|uniref:Phosducin n=1 Tax=Brachionus plicatilis TaxID=10195 RepID=A0A3M7RUI6_BRAPC|nr:phosducin [Brachionus plicatilis]